MSGDELQGWAAVIGAVSVAIGGFISTRKTARDEQHKVETGPIPIPVQVKDNLTERLDSDGVTKFLEIILKESADLRERVVRVEGDLALVKANDQTFRGALGRWLSRVYGAWGQQAVMPMPDNPEDLHTLRDVLPH